MRKDYDVNKPVVNPKLVACMKQLKEQPTKENELAFFQELEQAIFLVPVKLDAKTKEQDGNQAVLEKGSTISFVGITNANNEYYLPYFTDWNELGKWLKQKDQQTLMLSFEEGKELVLKNEAYAGLVINPYTENFMYTRDMLSGAKKVVVEKETSVQIGIPAKYPTKLVDAVKELLPTLKSVSSAYLLYMVKEGEGSYLMIVDTTQKEVDFPTFGRLAPQYLDKGEFLDMVELQSAFGQNAVKNYKPFYKKKKAWFRR